MRLVRENINEKFTEKSDPIQDMGIGPEAKLKKLQNKTGYTNEKDFQDDDLIVYLFKPVYDKWKSKMGSIKPEDVEIWSATTSGSSPIIKIAAPGVRETTMIRGEAFYNLVYEDIMKLLKSPEVKKRIANKFNKMGENPRKLTEMIYASANRKQLKMGGIYIADKIAERLIKILK